MPVLPLEPFVHPDDLLSVDPAIPLAGEWWVLHTRPRAEKSLARRLLHQDVSFFLPLQSSRHRSGAKGVSAHLPLFPSYIFLHGDGSARLKALETNLVAYCLPVPNQDRLVEDLVRVYRLMSGEATILPEDRLEPGTPVEIITGPFTGMKGKLLRRGNQLRFLVEVEFLKRGVSIEVDRRMFRTLA